VYVYPVELKYHSTRRPPVSVYRHAGTQREPKGQRCAIRTFSDHLRLRRTDPAFEHALQEAMPKKEPWGAGGQLNQGSDRRAFLAVVPAAAVTD
jgi:hypothetical protein